MAILADNDLLGAAFWDQAPVIQRKVSQCSKTAGGAKAFAAFASVIKTALRQGKDVVEWLSGLFRGIDPQSNPT
jgi:hypothetical protein